MKALRVQIKFAQRWPLQSQTPVRSPATVMNDVSMSVPQPAVTDPPLLSNSDVGIVVANKDVGTPISFVSTTGTDVAAVSPTGVSVTVNAAVTAVAAAFTAVSADMSVTTDQNGSADMSVTTDQNGDFNNINITPILSAAEEGIIAP